MIISLDYDDTYSVDPIFWNIFCDSAMKRGHTVYCITARPEDHMDKVRNTIGKIIGVRRCIGTGLKPKREFVLKNHNLKIDVWIDDTPDAIVSDYYAQFLKEE